jgi:hypothetical protein
MIPPHKINVPHQIGIALTSNKHSPVKRPGRATGLLQNPVDSATSGKDSYHSCTHFLPA